MPTLESLIWTTVPPNEADPYIKQTIQQVDLYHLTNKLLLHGFTGLAAHEIQESVSMDALPAGLLSLTRIKTWFVDVPIHAAIGKIAEAVSSTNACEPSYVVYFGKRNTVTDDGDPAVAVFAIALRFSDDDEGWVPGPRNSEPAINALYEEIAHAG